MYSLSNPSAHATSGFRTLPLLLAILALTPAGCGDDERLYRQEGVCDEFDAEECACAYGTGYRYCRADQTGFGECVCAVEKVVVGEQVAQIDEEAGSDVDLSGERGLSAPLHGNEALANLQVGDHVLSWELGLMGRVTAVTVEDGRVLVETEECALTDVFEELDISYDRPINLPAHMPEEMREQLRTNRDELPGPGDTRMRRIGPALIGGSVEGETEPVAGLDLSFEGEFNFDVDIEPESHLLFQPDLFARLKIKAFKLQHFAVYAELELDVLLALRARLEASLEATAELDIIELAVYLATGQEDFVTRIPLGAGLEMEFWALVGVTVGIDGFVEAVPYFAAGGIGYVGAVFSRDWDDDTWDGAPTIIAEGRETWPEAEWQTLGYQDFSAEAGISEFSWGAHGFIEGYLRPKYALTFLRCGGPTFDVQPFIRFDAWVGEKNKLEAAGGVRGHAGGKIELLGTATLWEDSWQVFEKKWIIWEYSWMLCGDGIRSTECYDLECDTCPGSGCGGKPEECDAGLVGLFPGQGFGDEYGDEKPCIPAGQTGACTCGKGWIPVTGDEWWWPPEIEDDYQWGERHNWCKPSCGDGVHQPEEGEVCDDGNTRDDDHCSNDCQTSWCICGDGRVDTHNGCWEVCDDGNTESGDGCRFDCISDETCGNGINDSHVGEECDDGNDDECDDCYSDCTRPVYRCGDGHKCGNEECDDGNLNPCDGCNSNCTLETGCGDGYKCGDEECDDGNTEPGDGCAGDCRIERCGDGVTQPWRGEECDDGNNEGCDGCHHDCRLDTGCGDGVPCLDQGEQCDDGNSEDCDSCHNDCTLDLGCGDGHICGAEECDNGNWNGHCSDCDVQCHSQTPRCGDGHTCYNLDEECDDGNLDDCDACHNDCTENLSPRCGDGYVCGTEVCDDGNNDHCDGCRGDCAAQETGCGDGFTCAPEVCDDGGTEDGDGCSANCLSNETCGNGVTDTAVGEVCDDGNRLAGDGCNANCNGREECGDGILDLAAGEGCEDTTTDGIDLGCSLMFPDCLAPCEACIGRCGDGQQTPTEACEVSPDPIDIGCTAALAVCNADCSACEPDCTANTCGDGVTCPGEACDNGGLCSVSGHPCTSKDLSGCDDPVSETCVPQDGDGCSADCLSDETCGNGVTDTTVGEVCDDRNRLDGDGCSNDCRSDETCGNGIWDTLAGEACEDTSASGADAGCTNPLFPNCVPGCAGCAEHRCGDGIHGPDEACDDGDQDSCTTACSADCQHVDVSPTPICGNGVLDCGEACDEGDTDDCDGCRGDCLVIEFGCGDGATCDLEACDDGNNEDCDGCRGNCSAVETGCGDTFVCGVEVCDDGNQDDCVGWCAADCSALRDAPVCGDDLIDDVCGETCEDTDPGNATADAGCSDPAFPHCNPADCQTCQADVCGDAITGPTEVCDNGGFCNWTENPCTPADMSRCTDPRDTSCVPRGNDGCSADCQSDETCGNGITDAAAGEVCDDGGLCSVSGHPCTSVDLSGCDDPATETCVPQGGDGCSADCRSDESCGNGVLDPGETCDDGNQDDCLGNCAADCLSFHPVCGDGTPECSEVCDDGDQDSCTTACSADCRHANVSATPNCGNGIIDCGEVCDDGNTEPCFGTCAADCSRRAEVCGDTIRECGEACDDGDTESGDGCSADCWSDETCGNGFFDPAAGEACDDGNQQDCVGDCSADCTHTQAFPISCGDGVVECWETCEDTDPTNATVDAGCTADTPNCVSVCSACSP